MLAFVRAKLLAIYIHARAFKHRLWCWLRRKLGLTPTIETRSLLQLPPAPWFSIEKIFWRDRAALELPLPRTLNPEPDPFHAAHRRAPIFDRYLARLRGARIYGADGFLYLPDGRLQAEHHFFSKQYVENHQSFYSRHPAPVRISGPVYATTAWCPGWHYHWMTEVLYRLHHVLELLPPETTFLIPKRASAVHRETLAVVGIRPEAVREVEESELVEIDDLWWVPPVTPSGFDLPEATAWVREQFWRYFLKRAPDDRRPGTRKLYVSRQLAATRRILNHDEFAAAARERGFECVHLEKMSLREQVALFADAREVVGSHGAGFVNLMFAPPHGRLLELFAHRILSGGMIFWSLANAAGWDYTVMRCPTPPEGRTQLDFTADLPAITAWMDRTGAE